MFISFGIIKFDEKLNANLLESHWKSCELIKLSCVYAVITLVLHEWLTRHIFYYWDMVLMEVWSAQWNQSSIYIWLCKSVNRNMSENTIESTTSKIEQASIIRRSPPYDLLLAISRSSFAIRIITRSEWDQELALRLW